MIARLATLGWLVVVFVAVLESFTIGAVIGGLLVAGTLLALFPPAAAADIGTRVRPLALLRAVGYFAVKLVQANLHVAWAVISPRRAGLERAVVAVSVAETSNTVMALLANAVSLTPGTLVIDLRRNPSTLYVHVLQLRSVDTVRRDVLTMQRALVRALGPAAALAEIDRKLDAVAPHPRGEEPGA